MTDVDIMTDTFMISDISTKMGFHHPSLQLADVLPSRCDDIGVSCVNHLCFSTLKFDSLWYKYHVKIFDMKKKDSFFLHRLSMSLTYCSWKAGSLH